MKLNRIKEKAKSMIQGARNAISDGSLSDADD